MVKYLTPLCCPGDMEQTANSGRSAVFGAFRFDLSSRELRKHGTKMRVEDKAARLLCVLIERAGTVVSRDELHKLLWPNGVHVDFDHGLNKCVNKLRLVLGDDSSEPRLIETLSRRGYRFIAPVEIVDNPRTARVPIAAPSSAALNAQLVPEASVSQAQPAALGEIPEASPRRKRRVGPALAIAACLLIAAVLAAARFSVLPKTSTHAASAKAEAIRSVVIQKNGAIDPLDEGFKLYAPDGHYTHVMRNRQNNGFDRWKLVTSDQNYYYRPLSDAEKDFALRRDWKLTCVCALGQGQAFSVIDFGKDKGARRFDIEFLQEGSTYFVALTKQISPKLEWERKIEFPGVADVDNPHTYEMRYDHLSGTASLWIDGQLVASGYHGHDQYRGDTGLDFGAARYLSNDDAIGVFRTVRFEAY